MNWLIYTEDYGYPSPEQWDENNEGGGDPPVRWPTFVWTSIFAPPSRLDTPPSEQSSHGDHTRASGSLPWPCRKKDVAWQVHPLRQLFHDHWKVKMSIYFYLLNKISWFTIDFASQISVKIWVCQENDTYLSIIIKNSS